jgi:hypothetical protein
VKIAVVAEPNEDDSLLDGRKTWMATFVSMTRTATAAPLMVGGPIGHQAHPMCLRRVMAGSRPATT